MDIISVPCIKELYPRAWCLGHGAFMNEHPIQVSDINDLKISMIELGWNPVCKVEDFLKNAHAILQTVAVTRTLRSRILALVNVANGRLVI